MVFSDLFREIYLDESATSRYKPCAVRRAVASALRHSANPGRSAHTSALRAALLVEETRAQLTESMGDGHVVFTKNCTEALNLALFGADLSGVVLTSVWEHNSVLRPLEALRAGGRIQVVYAAPKQGYVLREDDLSRALGARVPSFMVFSEQSNVTGAVQDLPFLKAFAKRYHVPLLVDAAQSLGYTDSDYSACLVAASGHKGLHGPQGTGFLFVPAGAPRLKPLLCGGTGTSGMDLNQPTHFPEGYESGTLNTPGIVGLGEGWRWSMRHHAQIVQRVNNHARTLYEGLKAIPGIRLYSPPGSHVISFTLNDMDSGEVGNRLHETFHISVRTGLHCAPKAHAFLGTLRNGGTVRVSPGVHNTALEIKAFLYAMQTIADG